MNKATINKKIGTDIIDLLLVLIVSGLCIYGLSSTTQADIEAFYILCPIIYFAYQVGAVMLHQGQTVGNVLTETRLGKKKDKEVSTIDIIIRGIVMTMPILCIVLFPNIWVLTIGFGIVYCLVPFFQNENLAIHDIASGSYYVETSKKPAAEVEKVWEKVPVDTPEVELEKAEVLEVAEPEETEFVEESEILEETALTYELCAVDGDLKGMVFTIDRELLIGRDRRCNIVLPADAPEVSRQHCKLCYNEQTKEIELTDLNSTFGTYTKNGEYMVKGKTVVIETEEEFYIGVNQRFRLKAL